MFRVVSDRLHSLSVVLRRHMNTKVFVLPKLFATISGGTVFFLASKELLQHRVHGFGALREIAIRIGRHHDNDF